MGHRLLMKYLTRVKLDPSQFFFNSNKRDGKVDDECVYFNSLQLSDGRLDKCCLPFSPPTASQIFAANRISVLLAERLCLHASDALLVFFRAVAYLRHLFPVGKFDCKMSVFVNSNERAYLMILYPLSSASYSTVR